MRTSTPPYTDDEARASITFGEMLVAEMQERAAGGTLQAPTALNDNNTAVVAYATTLAQYAEIALRGPTRMTEFRQYGSATNNGDGEWTIQYRGLDGVLRDWVTGIATRASADWSGWDASGGPVTAIAIRLICTAVDTQPNSQIAELEVRY